MTYQRAIVVLLVLAALGTTPRSAGAQTRDNLLNGAIVGAAIGAGAGVAFVYAVRDSDLVFSQYLSGALIFAAIGAGAGLGIDALFSRRPAPGRIVDQPRLRLVPIVAPGLRVAAVRWAW